VAALQDERQVGRLSSGAQAQNEGASKAAVLREWVKLVRPAARSHARLAAEPQDQAWVAAVARAALMQAAAAGVRKESGRGVERPALAWPELHWFVMEDG